MSLIDVKNVTYEDRGNLVLDSVTLRVEAGDFVAVIGPNGGGKTTLIKLLLGLIEPTRGTVTVMGGPPRDARGRIGYVPQYFTFDPDYPASLLDLVLMGRLPERGMFRRFQRQDRDAAMEAMCRLEIEHLAARPLAAVSGGELQRALIARALVVQPEILLLDEPTTSLDTRVGQNLYERLEKFAGGAAVVMVTHDIGVISRHVKSIACLNRRLYQHSGGHITGEILEEVYGCPVDLLAHGHPHRVLHEHDGD